MMLMRSGCKACPMEKVENRYCSAMAGNSFPTRPKNSVHVRAIRICIGVAASCAGAIGNIRPVSSCRDHVWDSRRYVGWNPDLVGRAGQSI
jgi:hypothetical protein